MSNIFYFAFVGIIVVISLYIILKILNIIKIKK